MKARQRVFHPVLTGGHASGEEGKSGAGQNEAENAPLSSSAGLDEQIQAEERTKQKGRE
jgi:hypothetical protein